MDSPRMNELRRRVQMDPASIAFAALAEEYRRAGRYDEAIATCRTGLARHPAYLSARVTLGRALVEAGEYAAARQELEQVLRLAPENLAAIRGLADIHDRTGEPVESLESLRHLLEPPAPSDRRPRFVATPEPTPAVSRRPQTDPDAPDAALAVEDPVPLASSRGPIPLSAIAVQPGGVDAQAIEGLERFLEAVQSSRR